MKSSQLNNQETLNQFTSAIENEDSTALAQLQMQQFENIKNHVTTLFEELKDENDEKILASRGVYRLTNDEKSFYDKMFNAVGMSPTEGGSLLIPKTIVSRVFDDLKVDDGVLSLIDLVNTTGASEWLVSVAEKPVCAWGELCSPITKELSVGFKVVNTLVNKLSCYIPYCKSLIDLGYEWQDLYLREYLAAGLRSSLSVAAISGNGANAPWGMAYDYDITTDTGAAKTPIMLKDFSRESFGALFATLSRNPMGYTRSLEGLTLITDSQTYYAKIFTNDYVLNSNGTYTSKLESMGVKVVITETGLTSVDGMTEYGAILGLPKRYFMQVGFKGNPNGQITFSDDALFLEDKRVYKAKLYADGFSKDSNAFILLDLSKLGEADAVSTASAQKVASK